MCMRPDSAIVHLRSTITDGEKKAMTVVLDESRLADELAFLSKALAHPARVRILQLLLSRESCYCGQIVDELPLAQATVSQHLKVLRDAGLIIGEIESPRTCYCANRERLHEMQDRLGELLLLSGDLDSDGCR